MANIDLDKDPRYKISLEYFNKLREEIMVKMNVSVQATYFKLVSVGAILIYFFKSGITETYKLVLLIIAIFLSIIIDIFVFNKNAEIVYTGSFIKNYIEKFWVEEFGVPETILWEMYIKPEKRKKIYDEFVTLQTGLTFFLGIGGIIFLFIFDQARFNKCSLCFLLFIVLLYFVYIREIIKYSKKDIKTQ